MSRITLHKINVWYILIAFLSCLPTVFYGNEKLYSYIGHINRATVFVVAITVIGILQNYKLIIRNKDFLLSILLGVCLFLSDVINNSVNISYVYRFCRILIFEVLIVTTINPKSIKTLIRSLAAYFEAVIILNVLCQFLFPGGFVKLTYTQWQPVYIIGSANSFIYYYLFGSMIIIIRSIYFKSKLDLHCILILTAEIISMVVGESSGGLLAMSVLVIGLIFMYNSHLSDFVAKHIKEFIIFIIVLFLVVIVFQSQIITDIIINVTGETHSFLERMYIWGQSISKILAKPLLGYGTLNDSIVYDFMGQLRTAHNNFLEIAIIGGLISLFIYLVMVIKCLVSTSKLVRRSEGRNKNILAVIVLCLIAYIVVFMIEQNIYFPGIYVINVGCASIAQLLQISEGVKRVTK